MNLFTRKYITPNIRIYLHNNPNPTTRLYTWIGLKASALTRFSWKTTFTSDTTAANVLENSLKKNFLMLSNVLMMKFGGGVVVVGLVVTFELSAAFWAITLTKLTIKTTQFSFSFIAFD